LLDHRVLERRLANRTLLPIVFFDPDALHERCLVASAAPALVQVAPVLVEVFGLCLRRYPIDPWGTCLARLTVRLPQKVSLDQVGQRREHPIGVVGGLRRQALECWGDGW
jgi:hypothetical protein